MDLGNHALNLVYAGAASAAAAGLPQSNPYNPVSFAAEYEAFELGRLHDMSSKEYLALSDRLQSLEAAVAAGCEGDGHDTIVRVIDRAMELSRWKFDMDTMQVVEKEPAFFRGLSQRPQPTSQLDGAAFAHDMTQMMEAWNQLGARIRDQCPQATDAQVEVFQRAFMAVELGLDTEIARQDTAAATKLLTELSGEDAETIQEVGREVSAEFFATREQRQRMR